MRGQGIANSKQLTATMRVAVLAAGLLCAGASAQQIDLGYNDAAAQTKKQHVSLLSDAVETVAGSPQTVELRFRVDPGFHINSHTPTDELLIPTALKIDEAAGVKVMDEEYPKGSAFRLNIGGGETLDVYQGEFRVRLRMVVPRGASTLTGTLHYQACDNASCFPPRSLAVKVALTAK